MASIDLQVVEHAAKRTMSGGTGYFSMEAGKRLKVETSPRGEEILNEQVPAGKVWSVVVSVSITELDA